MAKSHISAAAVSVLLDFFVDYLLIDFPPLRPSFPCSFSLRLQLTLSFFFAFSRAFSSSSVGPANSRQFPGPLEEYLQRWKGGASAIETSLMSGTVSPLAAAASASAGSLHHIVFSKSQLLLLREKLLSNQNDTLMGRQCSLSSASQIGSIAASIRGFRVCSMLIPGSLRTRSRDMLIGLSRSRCDDVSKGSGTDTHIFHSLNLQVALLPRVQMLSILSDLEIAISSGETSMGKNPSKFHFVMSDQSLAQNFPLKCQN